MSVGGDNTSRIKTHEQFSRLSPIVSKANYDHANGIVHRLFNDFYSPYVHSHLIFRSAKKKENDEVWYVVCCIHILVLVCVSFCIQRRGKELINKVKRRRRKKKGYYQFCIVRSTQTKQIDARIDDEGSLVLYKTFLKSAQKRKRKEKSQLHVEIIKATHTHTHTKVDVRQDDRWEKINRDVEERWSIR